jgi:hypothetical protein
MALRWNISTKPKPTSTGPTYQASRGGWYPTTPRCCGRDTSSQGNGRWHCAKCKGSHQA